MKNVTLAIDDATLAASRAYAKRHNTTLNQLIRDLLRRTVGSHQSAGVDELLRYMREHPGDSEGRTWTREEIHERHR
ncbi:MAG: hypothetical protein ACRD01_16680 [Terriglobales bacterium]